jgi:hypothetical protein
MMTDEFPMNFEGVGTLFRLFCYFRNVLRVGSQLRRECGRMGLACGEP